MINKPIDQTKHEQLNDLPRRVLIVRCTTQCTGNSQRVNILVASMERDAAIKRNGNTLKEAKK